MQILIPDRGDRTVIDRLPLADAARYCVAVMSRGLDALDTLPIQVQRVRYERPVDDFEGEARQALGFLGLLWEPGVLGYREAARHRRINTPSYAQVDRPIYRDAIGRWRRYAGHLEETLPVQKALVARLGYEASPG